MNKCDTSQCRTCGKLVSAGKSRASLSSKVKLTWSLGEDILIISESVKQPEIT